MHRPYIVCHMMMSLDGKVTGNFLSRAESEPVVEVYYDINRNYKADAFACGRVTMEDSFTNCFEPDFSQYDDVTILREDFVADNESRFFAVSFDRHGRVGWQTSHIVDDDPGYGGAHIIEVLCEDVNDRYLAYLRDIGVSYIFAGKNELDLALVLEKLKAVFGIDRMLLEGGSIINGAFEREGFVDELSIVVTPSVAAACDKPLFDGSVIEDFSLDSLKVYDGGIVWMVYRHI